MEADEGAGEDEEDVVCAYVVGFAFGGAGTAAGAGGRAAHGAARQGAVGWVGGVGADVGRAGGGGFFLLGLHLDGGAFDNLEERLLHAFAADVFAVAYFRGCDLVHFVQADYSLFGARDIVVRYREEALNAHFGVLAYVTGLGEGCAVGHAEWNGENAGESFGHEGFANT